MLSWVTWFSHFCSWIIFHGGFPGNSAGKGSACNAGDPGLIPGSGRSPGEGVGYLLQYSWASLVAQLVKNPRTMQGAWVRFLDWENLLEEGRATYSSILAWKIPMERGAWHVVVHGVAKSWTWLSNKAQHSTSVLECMFSFLVISKHFMISLWFLLWSVSTG